MPRGGNHPTHPKCPGCNKALYKTLKKGTASKKEDPFAHCRNEACELFGTVQEPERIEIPDETEEVEPSAETGAEAKTDKAPVVEKIDGPGAAEEALLWCQYDDEYFLDPSEID